MSDEVHSDWFGHVSMDVTDSSGAAFSHVDQLLTSMIRGGLGWADRLVC